MLPRFEKLITGHPVLVLLVSLLITISFGYFIPYLGFSSSSEEFFIQGDPDKAYFEKSRKLFGNDQVVVLAMVVPEGQSIFTRDRLSRLKGLTRELETIEGVVGAVSLSNVPGIRAPRDPVTGRYRKALEVKPLIKDIPKSQAEFERLKSEINQNPLYQDNLVSRDGRAAAIMVFIQDFEDTSRYNQVMDSIKRVIDKEEGEDSVYVAGVPETRVEIEKRMVKDLKVLLPLTIILIVVMLIVSFRQARGVFLPLTTIIMTTIWTMSFMHLVGISITTVTMILPPLMLAIGSSYSIHMMSEYMAEAGPEASVGEIVKHCIDNIAFPIVICGFTTMIGFGSLILNRIDAIKQLGIAAVAGILFAVIIALFVVPAALMLMRKPVRSARREESSGILDWVLDRVAGFIINYRKAIFYIASGLVICSLFGIYHVKNDTDFLSFFSRSDPVMKAVHAQTEHLAGAAPFNIIIETDRPDVFKHPAMLKRLEALQDWAVREVDGIDTTISIVDYIKLLNKAIHQNDQDYYKIPDTAQEVGLLFFIYSTSGSSKDLAPFITPDYSTVNVLVRSRLVGSTKTNQAIQRIEGKARELFKRPEFKPTGGGNIMAPLLVSRQEEEGVEKAEQLEDDSDIEVLDWNAGPADEEPDSSSIEGTEEGVEEIPWDEEESEMEELDWGDEDEDNLGDDVEVLPWGEDDEETGAAAGQTQGAEGKDISQPDKTIAMSLPAPSEKEFPWPQVDVHMTGTIYLMNKSAVAISKSQITGLVTALAAIFLVMSLLFLSTKIGLMAMLPNIFPIFILFGLMGFSGITLNFSTSLIAAIALGIGVDDTIQYINRYNMEVNKSRDQTRAMVAALKSMGRPMIYTSVALFFGFIILTLSDFVPIRQFGMLTAITIIVALLSNLLILPGLMITVRIITLWDLINLEVGENPSQYIKIFHGLSNHQARVAILMGHVEDYKDGDLIIREGDMGREMYVVLKGQVDIFRGEGDKEVFIFTINPGDTFGEMALLRQSERSASARARGEVKLFVVDEQTLHRLEKRYSRISSKIFYNITQLLSDRLQTTTDQLVYSADNQQ